MSEFKFACPVCGQHIKCDSSQAGKAMDCPTCFQKITVPQAPTDADQKFILTGSKVQEKVVSMPGLAGPTLRPTKSFPGALVVVLILCFMGAAAATIYWATIIRPHQTAGQPGHGPDAPAAETNSKKPPKPEPIAPQASDANWTLALSPSDAMPGSPVAGRIHGRNFIIERASFQNGSLTLRYGTHGAMEFGAIINFSGATAEELSGKSLNVTTNAEKAAKISLRWKDDSGAVQKPNFDSGYAMRLEFGPFANNRLPGKIYLCLPDDEKSYLMGEFTANVSKPKPKQEPKSK